MATVDQSFVCPPVHKHDQTDNCYQHHKCRCLPHRSRRRAAGPARPRPCRARKEAKQRAVRAAAEWLLNNGRLPWELPGLLGVSLATMQRNADRLRRHEVSRAIRRYTAVEKVAS